MYHIKGRQMADVHSIDPWYKFVESTTGPLQRWLNTGVSLYQILFRLKLLNPLTAVVAYIRVFIFY